MARGPIDYEKLQREGVPFASLPAGEKVFLQDDAGGTMYLVRSGLIDILMFGRVLETVGADGIFGEMSLIDDDPRSASAVCSKPSSLLALSHGDFHHLINKHPDLGKTLPLNLSRTISRRLRTTGRYLEWLLHPGQ